MFLDENKEMIQECLSAITQDAIAEIAAVSKQTVSNAFAGTGIISVSDDTKARITNATMSLIRNRMIASKILLKSWSEEAHS